MSPRLVAFYEGPPYDRMARVLAYTAAQHCPGWQIQIEGVTLYSPNQKSVDARCRRDTFKLNRWVTTVEEAPEGTPIMLIDADMMIRRSLDDIWDRPFDVAYTVRDKTRTGLPLNAGLIFARATVPARRFLRAWYTAAVVIKASPAKMQTAKRYYGAGEQAALAETLKTSAVNGVQLLALPCREWNCEDSEWARFDPALTRIVHIKGALRKAIFGGGSFSVARGRQILPLVRDWKAIAAEAHA